MIPLPLESELEVVRLKFYLEKYPEKAIELAIQHYEDFLALVIEYRKLKAELSSITASSANSQIKSSIHDIDDF